MGPFMEAFPSTKASKAGFIVGSVEINGAMFVYRMLANVKLARAG
jgi:hypothetical protein